jgi:hypothetical protein
MWGVITRVESYIQRHDFHLADGEEEKKRDVIFLSRSVRRSRALFLVDGEYLSIQPAVCSWLVVSRTCPEVQPWLYGYDAIKEVEKAVADNPESFSQKTQYQKSQIDWLDSYDFFLVAVWLLIHHYPVPPSARSSSRRRRAILDALVRRSYWAV